jgi:murein DD-endopeptidase MepM/ murein hydrolase activator NlpD
MFMRRAAARLLTAGWVAALALAACQPAPPSAHSAPVVYPRPVVAASVDPATWGSPVHVVDDFVFDGGRLHFELRRMGDAVIQTVRNDYTVAVTLGWAMRDLDNLMPLGTSEGAITLPGSFELGGAGPTVVLAQFSITDPSARYYRYLDFRARFGDPSARPAPYRYALPFGVGQEHRVIQGFHGAFSHTGSNEFAVDFACPEGTPVLATREGLVVATHDSAVENGTTPDYLDYQRTNFVVVLHDDGTLGEYMHLATGGVRVRAGQRIARAQYIALSGNTGYSTTPHLHFQVMTAGPDGREARSFPFEFEVAPGRAERPAEGRVYRAYERARGRSADAHR